MTASPLPVWRSLLFVPVTARRFVEGAHRRGADAIIRDLEDSVAPAERARARGLVAEPAAIDVPIVERARFLVAREDAIATRETRMRAALSGGSG